MSSKNLNKRISKNKVIYADPPWAYNNKKLGRGKNPHPEYNTMTLEELQNFPINNYAHNDCVLFMWAVTPQIPESMKLLESWGFEYKTMIVWQKDMNHGGLGYWFSIHTEFLIIAIRGKVKPFHSKKKNIIKLISKNHSKKPEYFRKLIEEVTKDLQPRIELFARTKSHGWNVFGNDPKLQNTPLEVFSD